MWTMDERAALRIAINELKVSVDEFRKFADEMRAKSCQKNQQIRQNPTPLVLTTSTESEEEISVVESSMMPTPKSELKSMTDGFHLSPVKAEGPNEDDQVSHDLVLFSDSVLQRVMTTPRPVTPYSIVDEPYMYGKLPTKVFWVDFALDLGLQKGEKFDSETSIVALKNSENFCIQAVRQNASKVMILHLPPAKPPEDGCSKSFDCIKFDSSAILDIKSLNWAFIVGFLVHYDGLVVRLKLIDKLENNTIFLEKRHGDAEGLIEFKTDIKLNALRKFGCIDNINMMSEVMNAGHFSESCNSLYRNLRLDRPASKQFVGKDREIFVLVLHKLVDDIFKYYEEGGSLGDHEFAFSTVWALAADHVACLIDTTFIECQGPLQLMSEFIGAPNHTSMINLGSFYYGMRLDSGQGCDLDPDTRVSSLCRYFHLDKLTATRDATIMVHNDVKQLTILRVWAFWDQITLKENSQEGCNENNAIIHLFGLLSIPMPVYLGSIIEEVSTVMVPCSEWHGKKMFENQKLLTSVLKYKLKSQGLIISYWERLDRITSPTHKNYKHFVVAGAQTGNGMVLAPPLHLEINESEDEKKKQEALRTKLKCIYKVIKDALDLTRVRKAELGKALVEKLFDDGNFMVWIDMYGHMEQLSVAHVICKPPGHIDHKKGRKLIEYVRRRPCNLVRFDEIDKGHHLVFNTLLTVEDNQFTPEKISSMIVIQMREDLDNRTVEDMPSNSRAFGRLRTSRDIAKKTISSTSQTTIEIDLLYEEDGLYSIIIRATLDELNMDLFSKYTDLMEKCPSNSKIDKSYDHDLLFLDITPLSIVLEIDDRVIFLVILKNIAIQKTKEQIFSTYSDNQLGVLIQVFEGESTRIRYNNLLGKLDLTGIPPAPSSVPQLMELMVCFDTNATDNFEVSVKDKIMQLDSLCNAKIYQVGGGTVTAGWRNDGPSIAGCSKHILMFSLSRPPEIIDLEDKVQFKGME